MSKKYDHCIREVNKKLKQKKIRKKFKCGLDGKENPKGKHLCKTDPYKICNRLK